VHLNKQLLLGRIGARGVKLTYNSSGTPICTVPLETEKAGKDGKVYTSYHRVEITGRFAEELSVSLEAGDEILCEGEHQYRSTVDPKSGEKKTTCVLSTWGIAQRTPAASTPTEHEASPEYKSEGEAVGSPLEAPGPVPGHKPRRPRYGKASHQPWTPN
jgi:single-stranded DNA-binding protein